MKPSSAVLDRVARHWLELRETLEHCVTRVPLYRGVPRADDPSLPPEEHARAALSGFPVLTKERLRAAFPHQLVPEGVRLGEAVKSGAVRFVGTSGTEGERVQVLWHQPWWDAQELDGFAPHGLAGPLVREPGYREAVLTTPVCSGNLCHVGRLPMLQRVDEERVLFLNQTADPALWSDDDVRRMADELEEWAPAALEADPAYLAHFASRLQALGRRPFLPRFIDLSYELPSRHHLLVIGAVFQGVPLVDAYGSTECGFVACACEAGSLHPNLGWTHAEVAPLAAPGLEGTGRLLVTTLANPWLNLVRFDTGDLVRPRVDPCPCGRGDGLELQSVEGRLSDLVVATDGRLVTPRAIDRALLGDGALLHWRLRQQGPADFELELVESGLAPLDAAAAAAPLQALLGAAPRVRVVRSVAVEASGKFRLSRAAHLDPRTLL